MIELSISKRITLWSVIIVCSIIFIFGTGSLYYINKRLKGDLINRLSNEADDVSRSLTYAHGHLHVKEDIEWEEAHHKLNTEDPIYVIIVDKNGNEFRRSENCIDMEIDINHRSFSRMKERTGEKDLNDQNWQYLSSPLYFANGFYGWIIVIKSLESIDHFKKMLTRIYFIGLPLMIFLAVLGSSTLAKRVLDPIQHISQKAREIQAGSLDKRLPIPKTKDEVAHLSQTLNSMLKRIEGGLDTIRQFSANASHELKTPLAIIHTQVEQLITQSDQLDKDSTVEIRSEIKRMSQIVDDLSILSKLDSNTIQIQKARLWINDIIYDEIIRFKKVADRKKIKLVPHNLTSTELHADEYWFRILLSNLIDNAIKYSPEKTKVEISMKAENNRVNIVIQDEGPGVSKNEISNLTDRFYRCPTTRSIPGSGLGLSIVQWVVDAHHWNLNFLHNEPKGLKVILTL